MNSESSIKILFQNEHAVIVDKPALWLSIPGRTAGDKRPILGKLLEQTLAKKVFPVHRLDAEVSGLILFGLTPEFHKAASLLFENKTVQKTYQAFSELRNFEENKTMLWTCKIFRGKKRSFEAGHGKESITKATVVTLGQKFLEWRLEPITGRSHQLRFELARHDAPILGDTLYGSKHPWTESGIALRAVQINFPEDFARHWSLPQSISTDQFRFPERI
jgi:tRNA pseudouridine32 synthase / 23S rRNA pseudouridine746 synthase